MKAIDINKIDFADIVIPHYYSWWVNYDKYLYKVLKGGRGGAKSTHIPIRWVRDIIKYPINGLVVRKVGNTLSKSCFENFMEAIEFLNVDHYFKDYKSPLRIVYKPTGQEILFRGADDPNKIKSIKTSKYPITKLWIEELAEFKTEDEVKVIVNSILRGKLKDGLNYSIDFSYNPPKRKTHWCNNSYETQFLQSNVFVHHSSYLDNPHISSAFIEEAQEVLKQNEQRYNWIYLGKPIGGGVVPFSNLVFDKITNEQIESFDNIRQGLDFGWKVDPTHFGRIHYDKKKDSIYILDEIRGVKLRNRILYNNIVGKQYNDFRITADNEDPRSIEELQSYGLVVKAAKKGPGSVEYGLEWLDTLQKIHIDPNRTPYTAKEYESIDYKLDKDGNVMNELDGEDHSIDMTRYALERDMKYKQHLF
jgi:phage terminase large subunit